MTTRIYLLAFFLGLLIDLTSGWLLGETSLVLILVTAGVLWLKKFFSIGL